MFKSIELDQINRGVLGYIPDAKETVEFCNGLLGMGFKLAIAEDRGPSTGAYNHYMHIFMDTGNDNVLAFAEPPQQPDMGRDQKHPNMGATHRDAGRES